MKAFYVILLLVFLASCGTEVAVETPVTQPAVEQVSEEIDQAIAELPEEIVEEIVKPESETEAMEAQDTPELDVSSLEDT
jgi:hypothetical protein